MNDPWFLVGFSLSATFFYCCRNESAEEYEKGSAGFMASPLGVVGEDSLHMNTYGVRTQLSLKAASKYSSYDEMLDKSSLLGGLSNLQCRRHIHRVIYVLLERIPCPDTETNNGPELDPQRAAQSRSCALFWRSHSAAEAVLSNAERWRLPQQIPRQLSKTY